MTDTTPERYIITRGYSFSDGEFHKVLSETEKTFMAQQKGWRARRINKADVVCAVGTIEEAKSRTEAVRSVRFSYKEAIENAKAALLKLETECEAAIVRALKGEAS
jgi:hypothetical protein